jgi:hypothetical protein
MYSRADLDDNVSWINSMFLVPCMVMGCSFVVISSCGSKTHHYALHTLNFLLLTSVH